MITDVGIEHLTKIPKLQFLYVELTDAFADAPKLLKLRAALPHCDVETNVDP